MGMSYEHAQKLGIAEFHPDHPGNRGEPPVLTATGPAPRSKYRNISTVYNGVRYDSKGEANHAASLDADQAAGLVRCWFRQVTVWLGVPENVMRVDFLVVGTDGSVWFDEYKGAETRKWLHDRKLWAKYGPLPLKVFRRNKLAEVIVPDGRTDA